MKRGIKRLAPKTQRPELAAMAGLESLCAALEFFREAGASCTAARVRAAISSARGAVRAAAMRERKLAARSKGEEA